MKRSTGWYRVLRMDSSKLSIATLPQPNEIRTMHIRYRSPLLLVIVALPLLAQAPQPPGRTAQNPQAAAPIDLTGYWVSIVTEDWRYRMVTPASGDYQGVPMNAAAKQIADTWDPAKDEAAGDPCKSYGAPALLRVPGLLRFVWQDERTLRLDTDAGTQS